MNLQVFINFKSKINYLKKNLIFNFPIKVLPMVNLWLFAAIRELASPAASLFSPSTSFTSILPTLKKIPFIINFYLKPSFSRTMR